MRRGPLTLRHLAVALTALASTLACGPSRPEPETGPTPDAGRPATRPPVPKPSVDPGATGRRPAAVVPPPGKEDAAEDTLPPADTAAPVAPAAAAYAHGWMPLASTGVDAFRSEHPDYDGRGVLIGILDTGIDPAIPGLQRTTTGDPKVLDLRDFSGESEVVLRRVAPRGDTIDVGGHRLLGAGRVAGLSGDRRWYGGVVREIPLGAPPAADLNGNGTGTDTLPLVVARATDGWVLLADTDGDGSLANERAVRDYLVARETFGWARKGRRPPVTAAANFTEAGGEPRLDLVLLTGAHGSHVAGIAAGHDLYGVPGFDGVAPGAQLLGLKIANSAQGGISTTGSMLRAIDYGIRFATARRLPLVLNMSFGVGNEIEGGARIDALVDSVLARHPELVFAISAGNDGPGLSTVGFPGSARRAISVGATVPPSFRLPGPGGGRGSDEIAYFSSRGGELAKPDLVTPGFAYSTVPRWNRGDEVEQGTSMASPHAAGLAALLVSGLVQERAPVLALAVKQALTATARPLAGGSYLDQGSGLPEIGRAWRWLQGRHRAVDIVARAVGPHGLSAAYRDRVAAAGRTPTQTFELSRPGGGGPATFTLRSDAGWLAAPATVTLRGRAARVVVRYDRAALARPGVYVGTVTGWSADTAAGPAFRLVNTVIVPHPTSAETRELVTSARVAPGAALRTFFLADSARPFEVTLSSGAGDTALAFLHEPDGMPFRDGSAQPAGPGDQGAAYHPDGRDIVPGAYEVVAVAPSARPVAVTVRLTHAPLLLSATPGAPGRVTAKAVNATAAAVRTELAVLVGGGERVVPVDARGGGVRKVPFVAPAWARGVVVDVAMDRAQWGRFTDLGVTLFDSVGRQLETRPLNYAFGRLSAELPRGHGDMPLELALFPGLADSTAAAWSLRATVRLYADSAVALRPADRSDETAGLTIGPGGSAAATFALPPSPWALPPGFGPLGVVVARTSGQTWTHELGLGGPAPGGSR